MVDTRAGDMDIIEARSRADEGFNDWSALPAPDRGRILFNAAREMERCRHEIVATIMAETRKTEEEAQGEWQSAVDMAYYMAGEGRRSYGDVLSSQLKDRLVMTKRYPIGVVGIITPWNFPFSLVAWKVLPALICGNAVILKPSSVAPKSADLFASIMVKAGLPKDALVVFHGGSDAGELVIDASDMISFTGSSRVGMRIAAKCGRNLQKVSLELGGKNAVIVMDDADIGMAVDAIIKGAFSFAGQRCSATSRVIVIYSAYNRFLDSLSKAMRRMPMKQVVNLKQADMIRGYIASGKRCGAKLLKGGVVTGTKVSPTVFVDVGIDDEIATDEIFGPVLCVFNAKTIDDAVRIHNSCAFGLSASVFTNDINAAFSIIDRLEAGVCYINAPTFGAEVHVPFGGIKDSGNGHRESGKAAIETFSELKTITIDYSRRLQNAQWKN